LATLSYTGNDCIVEQFQSSNKQPTLCIESTKVVAGKHDKNDHCNPIDRNNNNNNNNNSDDDNYYLIQFSFFLKHV